MSIKLASSSPLKVLEKSHFYSYGGANLLGYLGFIETTKHGVSHFVIPYSYAYTEFAFYWHGKGKVKFRIGEQPQRKPLRRNWNEASWLK